MNYAAGDRTTDGGSGGPGGGPNFDRRRPVGADEAAVRAAGKVSEALETAERARGHLYGFHQLTGRADLQLDAAVAELRGAGHFDLAQQLSSELIGRNVLPGRWSFQVVDDYDEGYYRCFQEMEALVRERLPAGRRHVCEAQLKEHRRTHGLPDHAATPAASDSEQTGE
jgi:hypothetical protein